MATVQERYHLGLTRADVAQLSALMAHFGETRSQVFKRALILLHYITFNGNEEFTGNDSVKL